MDIAELSQIDFIQRVLDYFYPPPLPIPLNSKDDYTFLIAVCLSAQSTDGKVNEVTNKLFDVASNPYDMVKLSYETILNIIRPVGLAPSKASNILKLSERLISNYQGVVPSTYEDLESLAGVGHKTASVIMSQCFNEPALAVDTHVHRLALRWKLTKENNVAKVQQDLCRQFPSESWNKVHLQMIYFGREYCTAKDHQNANCPICSWIYSTVKKREFDPSDLSSFLSKFSPQKKAKGIVYYNDRLQELQLSPSLAIVSSTERPLSAQSRMEKTDEDSPVNISHELNEEIVLPRKRRKTRDQKRINS